MIKPSSLMKNTTLMLFMALLLLGCKKNLSDLTEGMMFSLDMNSFLQNQVQVQIVNANYQNSTTVPNAKISISGRDAEKIFDINGSKTIVVEDQFANLAVSPGKPIQEGNPARFTIKAQAPGFLDYEKELTVSNVDSFMNFTIEMIEIANPIPGIAISNQVATLSGDQPAVSISANTNTGKTIFTVPANSKMMDDAGNRFTGNAAIRIEQYDPSAEPVKANIQNLITNYSSAIFRNGIAEDVYFAPISYLRVNIDNQSGRKIQLDMPAMVEVSLNKQVIDPVSGEPLRSGDQIMVYQKDPVNLRWNFIEEAQLLDDGSGNLKTSFRFVGTDEIALTRRREDSKNESRSRNCNNNLSIKFKRNSNVNTLHYIAVVSATNNYRVYLSADNIAVSNNGVYTFSGKLPQNIPVKVLIYQYESATDKGIIVGQTTTFNSCNYSTANPAEIDVNPPSFTNNPIARFQLYTICEEQRLIYLHEGRIQFRKAGSRAPYRDMGLALRTTENAIDPRSNDRRTRVANNTIWNPGTTNYSYLETDRMVNNTLYQFKTEIIGKRQKDGKTIRKTYTRNRLFNLSEFSAAPSGSPYNYYIMNRTFWVAPEDACEDFGY